VLLWYLGPSVLIVFTVFRSAGIDFRLIAAGSLVPLVVDAPFRRLAVGHTIVLSVAVLTVVMVGTIGRRRLLRRRLLCLPIGMMCGLLLSGAWRFTEVFWWPTLGLDVPHHALLPAVWVTGVLEVVGLVACWFAVGLFGLYEQGPRTEFLRTGRLREVAQ
jgi:hypothetical protein